MMDELVDNQEAVVIGDLQKNSVALPVVEPKFGEDCTEAAVREAVEELTLRRGEEGGLRTFIDTTNVGDNRWRPPLVDADWHAACQAIYEGSEREEWPARGQTLLHW